MSQQSKDGTVETVVEPINKLIGIADKNIDKLIEKIGTLGPEAQFAFNDTIGAISVAGYATLILLGVFLSAAIYAIVWGVKNGIKEEWKHEVHPICVCSGIAGLVGSTIGTLFNFSDALIKATHPLGYFILGVIK